MKMVRKFSNQKVTGRFASVKMGEMRNWESRTIEKEYFYLLDFDKDVVRYWVQCFTIKYLLDGKCHSYTPDVFVLRRNKRQVIELKPDDKTDYTDNCIKFEAARQYCEKKGYEFKVVTDKDLHSGSMLENIKLLRRYAKQQIPNYIYSSLQEVFISRLELSLGELKKLLPKAKPGINNLSYLYTLLYNQELLTNLSEPITMESKISLSKEWRDCCGNSATAGGKV